MSKAERRRLETFLALYDRCIRFGGLTASEFDELVNISREIADTTQAFFTDELLEVMVNRMKARLGEPVKDDA